MDVLESTDWGQVAERLTVLSRTNFARFRDAALGGKHPWESERQLLAAVARSVPEVRDLFVLSERFRIDAIRRLSANKRLTQWIHCSPGFPWTAGADDTHRVVLRWNPRRKVLYVVDDLVVASHSRALRRPDDDRAADRVRVIQADIFRPSEIREHPDIAGWLDWSQPIVLIHGDAWMHYPGTAKQAAGIMKRWVDELVNGSCTVSSHLLRPGSPAAAMRASYLEDMIASSPIDTLRFRRREEIEALFPKQTLPYGLTNKDNRDPGNDHAAEAATLQPWVVSGIGRLTGSIPPTPPPGSVGVNEAAQLTGLTKYQVIGLAENGLLPSTTGPRGRWQFQPDELREIIVTWTRMRDQGLTPPIQQLPRREPMLASDEPG